MDNFNSIKTDFLQINDEFLSLFNTARSIPGVSPFPFDQWEKVGHVIEKQINEDTLKIAVVGAIKSGKSTFINAFLEGDYLKRGAGVVTSIVTKIRKGSTLTASLFFKTWDEVNDEMKEAMILFPSLERNSDDHQFDIRRAEDRTGLRRALKSLSVEKRISRGTLDANGVLLASYLKGYERIRKELSRDGEIQRFEGTDFSKHKNFVGDDSLAVYLKDLELRIPGVNNLDDNIEIADCQGSDSPNPLHLSMIQDYLIGTHLIIYLVSSRTGIREADIKFLSIIKKMGLMENIYFVINCDLGEHDGLDDLKTLANRTLEEISVIKPGPQIFTFSTLFNLIRQLGENTSHKNMLRAEQWKDETELSTFSDRETERFFALFGEKLTRDRFSLLLKNHLERFALMAAGLHDWIRINHSILIKDTEGAMKVLQEIKNVQAQLTQLRSLISNTIDTASRETKLDVWKTVDRFFDARGGNLVKDIREHIRNYKVDYQASEDDVDDLGFSTTLYEIFQDFKRDVDLFMAEVINPQLIQLTRQEEIKVDVFLADIAASYDSLMGNALQKYEEALESVGISSRKHTFDEIYSIDLENLKKRIKCNVPKLVSSLRYTAKIRTEAIMRLKYYNLIKFIKKILKKDIQNEKAGEILALKDGVQRIKKETITSIISSLNNYKENLKFLYLFRLIDEAPKILNGMLLDRFHVFTVDISTTADSIGMEQSVKEDAINTLELMDDSLQTLSSRILRLREDMGGQTPSLTSVRPLT
ncbi:MAG: dynamin family protein [Syntrophobacterales bacterium]|nr:dynamin family protein [Syntrophobacterales bacterium]